MEESKFLHKMWEKISQKKEKKRKRRKEEAAYRNATGNIQYFNWF